MKKVLIMGAGSWGTALAIMLKNMDRYVCLWSHRKEGLYELKEKAVHKSLPGAVLPDGIEFESSLEKAAEGKGIIVFAVPSIAIRENACKLRRVIEESPEIIPDKRLIIVSVSKGIEKGSLKPLTDVIKDELVKMELDVSYVALSGPTHAEEVARGLPCGMVAASDDNEACLEIQDLFMGPSMRVYTNSDLMGVEICGAMKNIIALAAGASDGLGLGDNAKATLITRGMAEIKRLGLAMGCQESTFYGLAGIGDLIVTATSNHSRNHKAGYLMGRGLSPIKATKEVGQVVEGLNAIAAAYSLKEKYNVEMPIVEAAYGFINGKISVREAVYGLMKRMAKREAR